MSLINNMLQDLENRTRTNESVNHPSAHHGLNSVISIGHKQPDRFRQAGYILLTISILVFTISLKAMYSDDSPNTIISTQPISSNTKLPELEHKDIIVVDETVTVITETAIKPSPALPKTETVVAATNQKNINTIAAIERQPVSPPSSKRIPIESIRKNDKTANKTILDKKPRVMTPPQKAQHFYEQAMDRANKQDWRAAQKLLMVALSQQATHWQAREQLVSILMRSGRWVDALGHLQKGILNNPKHYSFAQQLAHLYTEKNQVAKAISVLETSLPYSQSDVDYAALLAALYQRQGRHSEAINLYQQTVKARPAQGKLWLGLAISLDSEGQRQQAIGAYQKAKKTGLAMQLLDYANQRLAALQ